MTLLALACRLLPCGAHVQGQCHRVAGAQGVDVEAASTGVAGIDHQAYGLAALPDVHKNALNALLVEFVVVAKTHQVLQQAGLVDGAPGIADLHAGPVGLSGDQTVAFE